MPTFQWLWRCLMGIEMERTRENKVKTEPTVGGRLGGYCEPETHCVDGRSEAFEAGMLLRAVNGLTALAPTGNAGLDRQEALRRPDKQPYAKLGSINP